MPSLALSHVSVASPDCRRVFDDLTFALPPGGERFSAALACVLLARPEPQLLVLDEPGNSLDVVSQALLIEVVGGCKGSLLVVSHDSAFVAAVELARR